MLVGLVIRALWVHKETHQNMILVTLRLFNGLQGLTNMIQINNMPNLLRLARGLFKIVNQLRRFLVAVITLRRNRRIVRAILMKNMKARLNHLLSRLTVTRFTNSNPNLHPLPNTTNLSPRRIIATNTINNTRR